MYGADISIEHHRELTEKVLKTAMAEFQDKGIKAVKMDDIAGALSMSKRTLYELFGTKEQLLLECVRQWQKDKEDHMDRFIKERKPNVIAIIVEFYRYQMKCLSYVSSSYFYDLHKYPAVIKWLEADHGNKQKGAMRFFKKGVEEGYFRCDVDFGLIQAVNSESMTYIVKSKLMEHYTPQEIFKDVTMLYIRGFCTMKGIQTLEEML